MSRLVAGRMVPALLRGCPVSATAADGVRTRQLLAPAVALMACRHFAVINGASALISILKERILEEDLERSRLGWL